MVSYRTATSSLAPPAGRGFSFVELLFAVLILGIGLIMIAAIFPVGLSQTKANFDETQAAAIGRSAVGQLAQVAMKTDYPAFSDVIAMQHADVVSATSNLPAIVKANMINVADRRYAWAGMYYRPDSTSNYAQVMVIVGNRSDPFQSSDVGNPVNGLFLLEPRPVSVGLTTGQITIGGGAGSNASTNFAALSGGYLVFASYTPVQADLTITPALAALMPADVAAIQKKVLGRSYRIGQATGAGLFEYFPGSEFQPITFTFVDTTNVQHSVVVNKIGTGGGFILGRNRIKAVPGADDFDGPLMDVAYYTSFVSLN